MKILVVDDNSVNLKVLELILKKDHYDVQCVSNSLKVLSEVENYNPDLILLDINMPYKSGFEVCQDLKAIEKYKSIPIIFISALSDTEKIVNGFNIGASDYIIKPFKKEEVLARVANHLKIKSLQDRLNNQNLSLENELRLKIEENTQAQMQTIFLLAKLAQSRDDDTGMHLERVERYCEMLAMELKENPKFSDQIDENFIFNIKIASPLHDIGKVGIPDNILLKPGKLTVDEFEIMKTHTIIGYKALNEVDSKFGNNDFISMGKVIARNHHERFDGRGYPDNLAGENIPLAARIMAIADVYDALRSKRVYKESYSQEKTVDIINQGSGTQFDDTIVAAFNNIKDGFFEISQKNK